MLSSIKKLLRKYFKSKPKHHVAHSIPPGASGSGAASKPVLRPEDETVLEDVSPTDGTSEFSAPPPYSPPLNSNHRVSPGFTARTQGPPAASHVEVRLGGGGTPMIPITSSVSKPMRQAGLSTNRISTPETDSVSSESEDSESDVEYLQGDYYHPNEDKRRPQEGRGFQHTSPPSNQGPRASSHSYSTPAQGSASDRAFGPGSEFDRAFGPGGTFDKEFGPGGTFERVFGAGGTFEREVREGSASHSTHFTHTNAYGTHFSSTSPNGQSSSSYAVNPDMHFNAGNTEYRTGSHDHPTRNMGRKDLPREKRASSNDPRVHTQYRPAEQDYHGQRPNADSNAYRQGNQFAPAGFFQGCTDLTINARNINFTHIENAPNSTTTRMTANSSDAMPQFRGGSKRAYRNV